MSLEIVGPEIPFFHREGSTLRPTLASRGPWGEETLSGRAVAGLLGSEIERCHGHPEFVPVRLTVDMFRMSKMATVEISTKILRAGSRIKLVEAEFRNGGEVVAHGLCQFLRRGERPEGAIWQPSDWSVPGPDELPSNEAATSARGLWDVRQMTGDLRKEVRQRRAWLREVRELVEGEPLTPFARVAVAADYASPFSQISPAGLGYINSDLTLYIHRLPEGEWIGFEVVDHGATEGISNSACRVYDQAGAIDSVTIAALSQPRRG